MYFLLYMLLMCYMFYILYLYFLYSAHYIKYLFNMYNIRIDLIFGHANKRPSFKRNIIKLFSKKYTLIVSILHKIWFFFWSTQLLCTTNITYSACSPCNTCATYYPSKRTCITCIICITFSSCITHEPNKMPYLRRLKTYRIFKTDNN